MGADSKYSFATGLAVPGNPVMQETPMSSPYMTSDDDDVLDIDDEDPKNLDEDPPDNSPYAQVRASVPATDNVSLSINSRSFPLALLLYLIVVSTSDVASVAFIFPDWISCQPVLFSAISQCCNHPNYRSRPSSSAGQVLGCSLQTNQRSF